METHPPNSLEELIHRELARLPERQAPPSLIPGVLARIQAREQRSWWQRPWTAWPFAIQLASIPCMLALIVGGTYGVSLGWGMVLSYTDFSAATALVGTVSAIWEVILALGSAVLVLARALGQQWLLWTLVVALAMYCVCVALGTLCYRIAWQTRR